MRRLVCLRKYHKDWKDAAIVTIDAIGEKQTATISTWEDGKRILLRHEVNFPNSLGLFYSAVTSAVGLKSMEDEYILMGMAAYGEIKYKIKMETHLFDTPQKIDTSVYIQ